MRKRRRYEVISKLSARLSQSCVTTGTSLRKIRIKIFTGRSVHAMMGYMYV